MNRHCEPLQWDSGFFGFRVVRLHADKSNSRLLNKLLPSIDDENFTLAYLQSDSELTGIAEMSDKFDIRLVDRKTTYVKLITGHQHTDRRVVEYTKDYPDSQLLDLAVESGSFSRFNRDDRIGKDRFEALYKTWIINSVRKKMAMNVLVSYEENDIVGFVTLVNRNDRGGIGIIAVDPAHKGKGIGGSLLTSAENWFVRKKYKRIELVTQADNLPACRLCERCGYELETVKYFYHIWRK